MNVTRIVAVYGGSFDPPTLGHLMVTSHLLLNHPELDNILIVPCYKQTGKNLSSWTDRFAMAKLAFGILNNRRVQVSDIEYHLGGDSATILTLQELQKESPDQRFRFVIGSDLQDSIKSWAGGDIIESKFQPLVIGRAGISSPGGPTPISPIISSTMVREALHEGRYIDAERYLTESVLRYIQEHKLYQSI